MSDKRHLLRAATALQQGRFDEALAAARALLQDRPAHGEALLICGLAALQMGRTEKAVEWLTQAVEQLPARPDARYNLAVAQERASDPDAAMSSYRRVLGQLPGQIESSCNLASLLRRQRRFAEAVDVLRSCRILHPDDIRVAIRLAGALTDAGDGAAAIELCQELLPGSPTDMRIHTELARALAAQGRGEKAIAHCRNVLATNVAHRDMELTLGRLLLAEGQAEDAVAWYREFQTKYPDDIEAVNGLAVALHRAGLGSEAAEVLEAATRRWPESAQTWFNLGAVYSDLEKNKFLDRAESATRRALSLSPDHAEAHACMGLIAGKTGRPALAIDSLRRAIELNPGFYQARINLADTLDRAGRRGEAIAALEAAIEIEPGKSQAYRQTGIFQLRDRRATEALVALEAAYERDMLDQRTVAHLAVAMEELGHKEAAARLKGMDRFIFAVRPAQPPGWESIAAFNQEFARDILAHPTLQWEPIGLAARGGSLTGNLLESPTPAILGWEKMLRQAIDTLIADLEPDGGHPFLKRLPHRYRLNSWACVVPEGGVIDTHIHEESWLSGAYYVSLPDAVSSVSGKDMEGWIEFGRPTREVPVSREPQLRHLRPEAGMLVMFPSYLFHRTLPFHGSQNRISVSFDLEPLA